MSACTLPPHSTHRIVLRALLWLLLASGAPVAVAHDSGNILFHDVVDSAEGPQLRRINSAGTFTDELTTPPAEYVDHSASWSPGGSSVVFERSYRWHRLDSNYKHHDPTIVITDRLGQRERTLYRGVFPVWSGASTNKIAFGTVPEGATNSECIHIINPDGTGLQRIACVAWEARTLCDEFFTCLSELRKLAWTRDGKYIVALVGSFVTRLSNPSPNDYWAHRLYAVEVATGRLFELRSVVDPHEQNQPISFVVGPNNTVYYDGIDLTGTPSIYRVDLDTNALTRITTGSAPILSPSGSRLAYSQREGTNRYGRVFIANADGTAPKALGTATPGIELVPLDWSPCNRVLVLRKQDDLDHNHYNRSLHLVNAASGVWRTIRENAGAEQGAWWSPQ